MVNMYLMTGLGIGHARAQRACHPGALPSTEAGRKRLSRTHEAAWKQGCAGGGVDRREERKGTAQAAAVGAILYKFELKAPQRPPLCVTVSRGEREGRAVAEAGAGAEEEGQQHVPGG